MMVLNNLSIVHAEFIKEMKAMRGSIMAPALIITVFLIAILSSAEALSSPVYARIPLQLTMINIITFFLGFFIIFMIYPSISVADDMENNTMNMILPFLGDDTAVMFGYLIFQLFFAFILVLVSIAGMVFSMILKFGTLGTATLMKVQTTVYKYYFFPTRTPVLIKHTSYSYIHYGLDPEALLIEIGLYFASIVPEIIIGLIFSRLGGKKAVSVFLSVLYYIVVINAYQNLTTFHFHGITGYIYRSLLVLSPVAVFSNSPSIIGVKSLLVKFGSGFYDLGFVSHIPVFIAFASLCLISIILLIIYFLPRFVEVKKWIKK